MSSYYEIVGEEPTYALAEVLIKAVIHELKYDRDLHDYSSATGYTEISLKRLGYRRVGVTHKNQSEMLSAIHLVIKHFPAMILKSDNSVYVRDSTKHLLNADDLLVMDFYVHLLKEYEERVNKYQRYLKKHQDIQHIKLLMIIAIPLILLVCAILVGD